MRPQSSRQSVGPGLVRLWWELRLTLSWYWLLPPLALFGSIWFIWQMGGMDDTLARTQIRYAGEIILPLAAAPLAIDLLPREMQQRTVAALAIRSRLWVVLFIRLTYALIWLTVSTLLAMAIAGHIWPHSQGSVWSVELCWAIIPSAFCLLTLTLLTALSLSSATAGLIAAGCCWLLNLYAAFGVSVGFPAQIHWLPALFLFGSTFPPAPPTVISWEAGKWIILTVGLALALLSAAATSKVSRLLQEAEA